MASNFRKTIEFCGKNYNKEVAKIVVTNIIFLLGAAAIYYFLRNVVYTVICLGALLAVDYFFISSYGNEKRKMIKARDEEFVQIISYFEIFINNKVNVYQCFRMLTEYSSPWMNEQISTFLQEIDNDKTVQPFVNFAHKFKAPIAENVMLSIYQMVDQGESGEQLNQFTIFFSQLSKKFQKETIDQKERSLSSLDTYPLIGTGATTVLITMSVLLLMGDIINVL